jgi:hypothetical protein
MSQSVFRRIVAAAALAAALVSASPAQAAVRWDAPAAAGVLERAWQWLTGFLPGGQESDHGTSRRGTVTRKGTVGPGASTADSGPVCASPAELERGGCIDPNG